MRSVTMALGVLVVAAALLSAPSSFAQDQQGSRFEGWLEMLYRNVDVDGSIRKYEEDFDGLDSGIRVRNLWANWNDVDSKFLDYARLDVRGLGGDPYERTDFRIGEQNAYDLKASYTTQRYLYNMFELIGDEDGHRWDTQRRMTDIQLKLYPTSKIDVVAEFRRSQRIGDTLWMKDINRNLFRLETPIDFAYNYYTVGATFHLGAVDVVFRQSRRNGATAFENVSEGQTSLEGFDPTVNTVLTSYDWNQQENSTVDLTTLAVNAVLGKRVSLTASVFGTLFGEEKLNSSITQDATFVGPDFSTGTPDVAQSIQDGFSRTDLEVDTLLADLDLSILLAGPATLHLQYRALSRDLKGTQTQDLEGSGTTTTTDVTNDYEVQTIGALFELRPVRALTVRLGYRTLDRELNRSGYDSSVRNTDFDSNDNETILAGVGWRPVGWFRLDANYEDGEIEVPFATTSLSETEQLRARAVFMPMRGMSLDLLYNEFQNRNTAANFRPSATLGSPACNPTNPNQQPGTCVWDHDLDLSRWAVSFSHKTDVGVDYVLRYVDQETTTRTAINYDTALFGTTAFGRSVYDVEVKHFFGQVNYDFSERWRMFVRYWSSDSDGANPVVPDNSLTFTNNDTAVLIQDFTEGEFGLRYFFPSGIFVGGSFHAFDYDDFNDRLDYDGQIFTVNGGASF